jgi:uncharacterized protein (TIGR02145 family)
MKTLFLFILAFIFIPGMIRAQVGINADGSAPNTSAMLDVKSVNRGLLLPRMTTAQRDGIITPAAGLIIFNVQVSRIEVFDGQKWTSLSLFPSNAVPCGYGFVDERNGMVYNTILIGDRCWMKENLNVGTIIDSAANQTDNGIIEKYCYRNLELNCDKYGGLYQWDEAMQYGGTDLCPEGWHLPSGCEWNGMITHLGGELVAGGKMKMTGTVWWSPPNANADNSSGFSALAGGYRFMNGTFYDNLFRAYFWTTQSYDAFESYYYKLNYDNGEANFLHYYIYDGFSVRCMKDL